MFWHSIKPTLQEVAEFKARATVDALVATRLLEKKSAIVEPHLRAEWEITECSRICKEYGFSEKSAQRFKKLITYAELKEWQTRSDFLATHPPR